MRKGQKTHGTRTCYVYHACRCDECKLAARLYAQRKRPRLNPLVDAGSTRRHIKALGRAGVGVRSVAEILGGSVNHVRQMKSGEIVRVTLRTQNSVLSIPFDAHSDNGLVRATKTISMIQRLRREGFTNKQLALSFEIDDRSIYLLVRRKRFVKARTAMKVEKFYNKIMVGG